MRILITGSRKWTDRFPILHAIEYFRRYHDPIWLHGGAVGADTIADTLLREADPDARIEVWKPEYDRYPANVAPLHRNDAMLNSLHPDADLVLAFLLGAPKHSGTLYTINGAKSRGLRTIVYNWPEMS